MSSCIPKKKKKTECIKYQINKIRDMVEDRQSRIALQTVNEMGRRMTTARVKIKATSQEERIHLWKQLTRKTSESYRQTNHKNISNQLNI